MFSVAWCAATSLGYIPAASTSVGSENLTKPALPSAPPKSRSSMLYAKMRLVKYLLLKKTTG